MNDQSRPLTRQAFPPFLFLLAAFAAGVFLDRAGWLPGRTSEEPPGVRKTFGVFWEAWHKVKDNYVDRSKVDDKLMTQGAIRGMLDALGDRGHTTFLTEEERERTNEQLSGKMEGIGARMSVRQRRPIIVKTMPKSPARSAGLKAGDVLVAVDGLPVEGLSLSQIVSKVRGPAGTNVNLRIQRDKEANPRDVSVTRAKVDIPEVSWVMLPGTPKVAHLSLQRFSKDSSKQFKQALEELQAQGAEGVVLDVRANLGGYKDECVEIASQFLPAGTVLFVEVDARGHEKKITAKKGGVAVNLPVVCLIDGGSASSAEILAGALQDHHRAKLVGTRTFGTGTVLREFVLSDGSAVRLAIYQWKTPNGRTIWHEGISPDPGLEVRQPAGAVAMVPDPEVPVTEDDIKEAGDVQLLKAICALRDQLEKAEEP